MQELRQVILTRRLRDANRHQAEPDRGRDDEGKQQEDYSTEDSALRHRDDTEHERRKKKRTVNKDGHEGGEL
jgi:hypothetical protein